MIYPWIEVRVGGFYLELVVGYKHSHTRNLHLTALCIFFLFLSFVFCLCSCNRRHFYRRQFSLSDKFISSNTRIWVNWFSLSPVFAIDINLVCLSVFDCLFNRLRSNMTFIIVFSIFFSQSLLGFISKLINVILCLI